MHRHHLVEDRNKEIPLDCKEIKPDNPKGNQPWIFIGRTDVEAETQNTCGHLVRRVDLLEKTRTIM